MTTDLNAIAATIPSVARCIDVSGAEQDGESGHDQRDAERGVVQHRG
ncbi:MAG: hypothetical protein R3D62_09885 [Xanthobacteraceae bacterium]